MKTKGDSGVTRIAMWSGPRNISTALMRAWENRPDTVVTDEPFYAYYLSRTAREHPGREEVLAAQPTDWRDVVSLLSLPLPQGATIQYQKQMAHHLDAAVSLDWVSGMQNCFLIRQPANMLASLLRVLPDAQLTDTGLPQQRRLFDQVCQSLGKAPPVIDSAAVLRDPAGQLRSLCDAVGVEFTERMLRWPPGPRDSDGVWAPYWYDSVQQSTGFAPWQPATPNIPGDKLEILEQCDEHYAGMARYRLQSVGVE
ncbi:MAG: HAD family hydrolase [Gammaproteobacteria bacterium]|nr:HAD family hydrolase [Gammaproteobacteria bacterium]